MRQLIVIIVIVVLMVYTDGQYPNCIDGCPTMSIPLIPLSYNTKSSHVFSGSQPSNGGCTNGTSNDGQTIIDCGSGTALLNCDSDFNRGNFSDLSNLPIFSWSKTPLVPELVDIIFTFNQQISIKRIRMFFWNSTSDSIEVPIVKALWSDDDTAIPSAQMSASYNTDCSNGGGGCVLTITDSSGNQFQYLRILMTFYNNHEWIFLSEVQLCGNTAPYHITQPSANNYEQIIPPTATMANITCALNISIPSIITVSWTHNENTFIAPESPNEVIKNGSTVTLLLRNLQPSDLGDYKCEFSNTIDGWILRRTITLVAKTECSHLSIPANGEIVSCSSGTEGMGHEGDTCSFTCNTGYKLTGSDTRTCQSNGSWSGSNATCRQVFCPSLTNPSNGVVTCALGDDEVPSHGDTCTITCNPGYDIDGDETRTCQSDGSWSGSNATCRIASCPVITNTSNELIISCSLGDDEVPSFGDTCNFTCNTGYGLIGSDTRTCQSNGSWSGNDATCIRGPCLPINNTNDGILLTCSLGDDGVLSYEDSCSFTCTIDGLNVTGSRTCQSNGKWSNVETYDRCEIPCSTLISPNNGMINCSLGDDGVPFYKDTCSFTCKTGYELTGSDTRTCQSNGSWSGSNTSCTKVSCPPINNTNDGTLLTCLLGDDGVLSYEDTCSFTCTIDGLNVTGNRTCQSNGKWSNVETYDRCEIPCSTLSNPDNGMISCSLGDDGVPFYKDTCSFTCNTGYELTGSDTRTCQSNGSWSGNDTLCIKASCQLLSNPTDGMINCSLVDNRDPSYGDSCSFTCNTGYELTGSDTRTCQSDASWSGSDVTCIRVSCPTLTNPNNGTITCSLGDDDIPFFEDTCNFTCNTGYELTGSSTTTCQSDGSWSSTDVVCRRVPCIPLTKPDNGTISCSLGGDGVASYEDICRFTCNTGYSLIGSDTRTCQSNRSWSGSDVACKEAYCPALTNPNNGAINCSLGDDGTPSYEDTCHFTCNADYVLTGSDTRTCRSDGSWSGSEVVCKRGQCQPPINGNLHCPTEAVVGANCTFSCKQGFRLQGPISGICLENQNWSGGNPICEAAKETRCLTYEPTEVCENFQSIFDHPVKIAVNTTHAGNISISQTTAHTFYYLLTKQLTVHKQCLNVLLPFVCRWVFPTCDPAFNVSIEQYICRRSCEILTNFVCNEVWLTIISQAANLDFLGVTVNVPICDYLEYSNGGDAPDCIDTLDGGKIPAFSITSNCFNGRGRGYSGNISTTRSNKTCQRWSEQTPHQFILPSHQYPEIAGDHNYCRNPGSKGAEGPWCFTTDPNTRWEYCDVPKCEPSASCELYHNDSDAICFKYGSIGMDYVFLDNSVDNMDSLNSKMNGFHRIIRKKVEDENFPTECIDIMLGLMCHNSFPLCDYSSSTPQPRQICRSYCEEVSTGKCRNLWEEVKALSTLAILKLPDCDTLPSREGGEYLECFIPYNNGRNRRDINSTNCYTEDDLGIRYNGTLNVTDSGRICQAWDSNTPHFHPLTSLHRYYLEDHNYCRNPEGRGRQPWCYTMDPSVRWEYCNVPNCSSLLTSTDTTSDENNAVIIAAVVVFVSVIILLVTLLIIIVVLIIRRATQTKETKQYPFKLHRDSKHSFKLQGDNNLPFKLHSVEGEHKYDVANNDYYTPKLNFDDKLPNMSREIITYISDLGQGNFGVVMKGEAAGIIPGEASTLVAIKVLKEGSNKDAKNDFIKEALLMNQFDHPNILKLLGVCFDAEPFCLIFEYMDLGDLNNYLRKTAISCSQSSSSLTTKQLVDMAINIAGGLEYLSVHRFVHRDLATRNCLINEKLFVKISDFGLSKDVYSRDYYKLGEKSVMPIRWMPPEAILFSTFSSQSDVWSFGIVLWEIFTSGTQPYCALSNEEVVDRITNGHVLRCPSSCPDELYQLMVHCWATEPKDRPTASEIYADLLKWSPSDSATQPAGYVMMKSSVSSSPGLPSPSETAS